MNWNVSSWSGKYEFYSCNIIHGEDKYEWEVSYNRGDEYRYYSGTEKSLIQAKISAETALFLDTKLGIELNEHKENSK